MCWGRLGGEQGCETLEGGVIEGGEVDVSDRAA
jgi:hypothetical protein